MADLSGKYMHLDDIVTFAKEKLGKVITPQELESQPTTRFVTVQGDPGAINVSKVITGGKTTLKIS